MKTSIELNEVVTQNVFNLVARYLEFDGEHFNAHVEFLGLDPSHDFRFADLAGLDFSGADLRGFDFTGADLRGVTGANVEWDKTTILDGADTSDSLFAHRLRRSKFLSGNPTVAKRIDKLLKEHWTNTILGVEKVLNDEKYLYGTKIAQAVFDDTDDIVVRSNVLLFMRLTSDSGEEHREFIFNIIARHGSEVNVVRAALRALAALYPDNKASLNVFKAYLAHEDWTIRKEALGGIINSVHLPNMLSDIFPYLSGSTNGLFRREVLARIAQRAGADYIVACWDTDVSNALDYEEPITERKLQSIAEAAILRKRYAQIARDPRRLGHHLRMEDALNVKQNLIFESAATHKALLEQLRLRYSIPFVFKSAEPC